MCTQTKVAIRGNYSFTIHQVYHQVLLCWTEAKAFFVDRVDITKKCVYHSTMFRQLRWPFIGVRVSDADTVNHLMIKTTRCTSTMDRHL